MIGAGVFSLGGWFESTAVLVTGISECNQPGAWERLAVDRYMGEKKKHSLPCETDESLIRS
jgi:hypothetical protein